jgi:hypothetical protein
MSDALRPLSFPVSLSQKERGRHADSQFPSTSLNTEARKAHFLLPTPTSRSLHGLRGEISSQHGKLPIPCSLLRVFLTFSMVLAGAIPSAAWGRRAHQMVNAAAIKTLPSPLRSYFAPHQFYLVDHASDPDLRARNDRQERPRHFAEIEAYDRYPFLQFRREFVLDRLGPSAAQIRHGTVTWQIARFTRYLERDFRQADWSEADHDAVYLAHYAADLTQPLHTVVNYDGQQTRQRGIHARFEVGLVDLLADRWVLRPRPATSILNLRGRIFEELINSYRQAPAIFAADRNARASIPYTSPRFLLAFARAAGPVAYAQLENAASFVGSLWYTAWVRAGKPDLSAWKADSASAGGYFSGRWPVARHRGKASVRHSASRENDQG